MYITTKINFYKTVSRYKADTLQSLQDHCCFSNQETINFYCRSYEACENDEYCKIIPKYKLLG